LAEQDRNLYLAIGHELSFGLRIGEMAQAKWGWHQVRSGYPVLDGAASVKNGSAMIQVRALDPWYSHMQFQIDLHNWRTEPADHIIIGSEAYRQDGLYRAISDWLRHLGWETKKTNHALRAYAGGQVAMKYGIYEAQMFLRHSTVKVTEQNYSHFVKKFRPQDPNTIAARWAMAKVTSTAADVTLDDTSNVQESPSGGKPGVRLSLPPVDFERYKN
jgi:integrase